MSHVITTPDAVGRPSSYHTEAIEEMQLLTPPANISKGFAPKSYERSIRKKRSPHSKLFMLLSAFALLICVINFLQLGLLNRLDSFLWINVPPAILFALTGLMVAVYLANSDRRTNARVHWKESPEENKVARVGAILTIIIIIVICQFVYMNTTAIPQWRNKTWNTTFAYEESIEAPALLIFRYDFYAQKPDFAGDVECFHYNFTSGEKPACNSGDVRSNVPSSSGTLGNFQYHIYNPNGLILENFEFVQIRYDLTWNSSALSIEPFLSYAFVDPQFVRDTDTLEYFLPYIANGACSAFSYQFVPTLGTNYHTVSRTQIDDKVDAMNDNQDCKARAHGFEVFSAYESSITNIGAVDPFICDVASENYNNATCVSNNVVSMNSLVTYRTSHRGTDAKKIIVDESAIAGGVMFFTWFLGLYVL